MPHRRNPGYKPGDHWVECDVCGFEYRDSIMRKRWDGLIVCPEDWEVEHPQRFVRAREDDQASRGLVTGQSQDTFISGFCTTSNKAAIAGVGVAGCAVNGADSPALPGGTF